MAIQVFQKVQLDLRKSREFDKENEQRKIEKCLKDFVPKIDQIRC